MSNDAVIEKIVVISSKVPTKFNVYIDNYSEKPTEYTINSKFTKFDGFNRPLASIAFDSEVPMNTDLLVYYRLPTEQQPQVKTFFISAFQKIPLNFK